MAIVFNNISKQQNMNQAIKIIDTYKTLLVEDAIYFYCEIISDETSIDGLKDGNDLPLTWRDVKKKVIGVEDYKE